MIRFRKITAKDVAKRAGVSVGTVSNVLNDIPTVKKEIRQSVLKAIKELDYRPNRIAKSLASGRSQMIAFIIPDISNPFFPEMIRGATDKASELDYGVLLANTDNDYRKEIRYLQNFSSQGVDGLIISTSDCSSVQVDEIEAIDIPVVIVDRQLEGLNRDLIIVDNFQCAKAAVNHLINLGCQRIGMILGPAQTITAKERFEGGKKALQEKGLFNEELIRSGSYSFEGGFENMMKLLKECKQVDGLFCANDMIAIGAIKAIEKMGHQVPKDIAVVGFDDIQIASLLKPSLTTIRQPTYDVGAIAVRLVIERIQGIAPEIRQKIVLPGELVIRESTMKTAKDKNLLNDHFIQKY